MFEVGFSELLLIMALALIVLGPEKLPKVASQVGRWMGRARSMARQFRETLEEEVQLDATPRRPGANAGNTSTSTGATATATAAAAGGLAAGATDTDPGSASTSHADVPYGVDMPYGADVPYTDAGADAAAASESSTATTAADDPDTRHNDYAGAAYQPPDALNEPLLNERAMDPQAGEAHNADPAAVTENHGQRGT